MYIGKAVADQSHVTIPKGPEEVHTPKMKQIIYERKKIERFLSPRFWNRNHDMKPTFKI